MMTVSKFAIANLLLALLVPQQASAQDAVSDCLPDDAGGCADEVNLLQHRASSAAIQAGSRKLVDTEFAGDMVFHPPGYLSGRMNLKLDGSAFTGYRLATSTPLPTVRDFTSTQFSVGFRESNGSIVAAMGGDSVCFPWTYHSDLFKDLVEVEDGSVTFNGSSCERGMRAKNRMGNMTLCLDAAGVPINLYISMAADAVGQTNVLAFGFNVTFENISLGELPEDAFSLPDVCREGPPPVACPVEEGNEVETMSVTRYQNQGGEECGLGNKMVNDDLAAMVSPLPMRYVQVFNVTVDRRWAHMPDCNFHPSVMMSVCTNGLRNEENEGRVGRSSNNYYTGPNGGQCAPNDVVGSWYAFPSQGECAAGWAMGYRNCTWKTNSFKLIESWCVLAACSALVSEKSPFTEAIKCFNKAKHDCPDVSTSGGILTGTCLVHDLPACLLTGTCLTHDQ